MDAFSNREIAIAIWITLAVIFLLYKTSVSKVVRSFLALFRTHIVTVYLLMLLYVFGCIGILELFSIWDNSQIKNVVLWFITVASISFLRIDKDPRYFYNSFIDNIKIVAIFQFVTSFYSFSLVGELLLVPFVFFLSGAQAFAQYKKEYRVAGDVVGWIVVFVSSLIILYTVFKLYTQFYEFKRLETLLDFIVPMYLSIMILPFHYFLSLYIKYEVVLIRIKSPMLKRYFIFKVIKSFGLKREIVDRLIFYINLNSVNSKSDIDSMVSDLKRQIKVEKKPPIILPSEGWCPYKAKELLKDKGLPTGNYKNLGGEEWFSCSNYLKIGDSLHPNNISYYVDGNSSAAKKLQIVMIVYYKNKIDDNWMYLLEFAGILCKRAIGMDLGGEIRSALVLEEPCSVETEYAKLEVLRNEFPGNLGYSLKFCITHSSLN